ncbi:hypothetical protein V8E55_005682 [Tylopilus felleus]
MTGDDPSTSEIFLYILLLSFCLSSRACSLFAIARELVSTTRPCHSQLCRDHHDDNQHLEPAHSSRAAGGRGLVDDHRISARVSRHLRRPECRAGDTFPQRSHHGRQQLRPRICSVAGYTARGLERGH